MPVILGFFCSTQLLFVKLLFYGFIYKKRESTYVMYTRHTVQWYNVRAGFPQLQMQMACLIIFWIALNSRWPPHLWTLISLVRQCFSDAPTAFSFDFIMMSYLSSPSGRVLWRMIQQLFGCSVVSGTSVFLFFFLFAFSLTMTKWQHWHQASTFALLILHNKLAICMFSADSSVVNTEPPLSEQGYNGCNVTIAICGQCQVSK